MGIRFICMHGYDCGAMTCYSVRIKVIPKYLTYMDVWLGGLQPRRRLCTVDPYRVIR